MKFIRKLFLFSTSALLIFLAYFAYNRLTDGFSLYQMKSSLSSELQIESEPLTEDKKLFLQSVVDQPFRYIGKGCQFYVFESQDQKYVIKFLKQKHLRSFTWLKKIPLPTYFRVLCDEKIERRKTRVSNLFSSCKLAFEEMAEETGILFIHLNTQVALDRTLVLTDKLGLKHRVVLDDYEYVIQKRAISLKEAFSILTEEQIKECVYKLARLVRTRCQKGICDRDRSFVQNIALSSENEDALFVDIGQFYKDAAIAREEETQKDLKKRLGNLRFWTEKNFPEYSALVTDTIQELVP